MSKALHKAIQDRVTNAFRRARWRVTREPRLGSERADLLVEHDGHRFAVEIKVATEGRRDRLVPLFAEAVLRARAHARQMPAPTAALAVVAAPRIAPRVVAEIEAFARTFAPDVAFAVLDGEEVLRLEGTGLERVQAKLERSARPPRKTVPGKVPGQLFSDLNQWMLKVLLAPLLPSDLLTAPRADVANVSGLAKAAGASVMTAFRFAQHLKLEGFLDETTPHLRLVRIESLLSRWGAAADRPSRDIPMNWVLPGDPQRQLKDCVVRLNSAPDRRSACLGLFAAAASLGYGHVHGVPPHLLLDEFDPLRLEQCGLMPTVPGDVPSVFVRVPIARRSVFRAAVEREGVLVADILQVWLDVSSHPSRGREQADLIQRKVLGSLGRRAVR